MRFRIIALAASTAVIGGLTVAATTVRSAPAHASTAANTINGVLTYDDGTPAAGKPVELVGERLVEVPAGTRLDPLPIDATVTDALGRYTLTATAATPVVQLAQQNEGFLNATVRSVFEVAPLVSTSARDASVYGGAVGVVFNLVNDPLTGLVFVGPGTVNITTSVSTTTVAVTGTDVTVSADVPSANTSVSASPQPEPDAESSPDPIVNNTVDTVTTAQETVNESGVNTGGVVGIDSTTADTVVDAVTNATGTSAIVNEIRVEDDGGTSDPHTYPARSEVCQDQYTNPNIRWSEKFLTYSYPKWVTVGEMHLPSRTEGKTTFETSKYTTIGVGYKIGSDGWEVSGSSKPAKTIGGGNGVEHDTTGSVWGRHIKALYRFHDYRTYYCRGSEKGTIVFQIVDERRPIYWNGSVVAASTDLSGWDSKTRFDRANADNRTQRFAHNNTPFKYSGDGYNYTHETCVLGLCLGSETDYSEMTKIEWDFDSPAQGGRDYYWLFGNDARPLDARIVYAYG